MRPENKRMQEWLLERGIDAKVKWIVDGSLKRSWRLYGKGQKWTKELADKLNELGFVNLWKEPLDIYSGNGGEFSVFVKGHEELLNG